MDAILRRLSEFARDLRFEDLPVDVVHASKRALVDSFGCAFGAFDTTPAVIARGLTENATTGQGATVLGTGIRTMPDLAAFANGVMIRCLDFNDTFECQGGGGHPSDYIPAVLAAAERGDTSGRSLITGIVIAYEIFCRMTEATNFAFGCWDHVTNGAIASAAAAAAVLDLGTEEIGNAISMATVSGIALHEARIGNLTMWKGCASASACRNGVFVAMLAADGMTAPGTPFAGRHGFFTAVSGAFDPPEFAGSAHPFSISACDFKSYPSGYFSQTAIEAAIEVRAQLPSLDGIETIDVGTSPFGLKVMAGDEEKWSPTSRESADHSLPYTVAATLLYGDLGVGHFDAERLRDRRLLSLLRRVSVREDPASVSVWPEATLNSVTVTTEGGKRYSSAVKYHRGHHLNPLTDAELESKFHRQTIGQLVDADRTSLLEAIWTLDEVEHVSELLMRTQRKQ